MSKHKKSDDNPDESAQLSPADRDGLDKAPESPTEHELFKDFDENRRSFLKKLLISAAYITPVILSISIRDADARKRRKRPTRKERKRRQKKKKH
ncbi:MAG: hypothetical protein ACUZ8I_15135 [Candidatus Scalindua sp.]